MKRNRLSFVAAAILTVSCGQQNRQAGLRPPNAPQPMMERQIRNAVDAGEGDYQTRVLRQRVAAEPDNLDVRLELARVYRERGFPELALEHCRLAAARFPESASARLAMARALRDSGLKKEAVEGLEAFLKQHPQTSPAYVAWVGILRDEMGEWTAGETAHRAALAMAPRADYLHNNLGYNLMRQNRNEEAAMEFREALKFNGQSQVARNNLGLALANTEAKELAVTNWQSAAGPATAHNNLAAVLIEKGRYQEARKELEQALGYNKQHPAALKNLSLVYRLEGAPLPAAGRPVTGSRWSRFKTSFRRLWVGPLEDQPAPAAKPAAAE
jgi:tetratricopeptide (TPR) repeat protein